MSDEREYRRQQSEVRREKVGSKQSAEGSRKCFLRLPPATYQILMTSDKAGTQESEDRT
jgi:hypothetical protein